MEGPPTKKRCTEEGVVLSSVAPQAPCESLETGETLTKLRAAARAAVSSVSSLLVLGGPGDEETASGSPPTACAAGAPNSANPSESACDDRGAHSGTLPSLVTGSSPAESTPAFSKSMPAVGSRASFNESVPFGAPAGSSQSENGLPRASAQLVPTSLPSQAAVGARTCSPNRGRLAVRFRRFARPELRVGSRGPGQPLQLVVPPEPSVSVLPHFKWHGPAIG